MSYLCIIWDHTPGRLVQLFIARSHFWSLSQVSYQKPASGTSHILLQSFPFPGPWIKKPLPEAVKLLTIDSSGRVPHLSLYFIPSPFLAPLTGTLYSFLYHPFSLLILSLLSVFPSSAPQLMANTIFHISKLPHGQPHSHFPSALPCLSHFDSSPQRARGLCPNWDQMQSTTNLMTPPHPRHIKGQHDIQQIKGPNIKPLLEWDIFVPCGDLACRVESLDILNTELDNGQRKEKKITVWRLWKKKAERQVKLMW